MTWFSLKSGIASTGVFNTAPSPSAMIRTAPHATKNRLRSDHSIRRLIIIAAEPSFYLRPAFQHLSSHERIAQAGRKLNPPRVFRNALAGLVAHWTAENFQFRKVRAHVHGVFCG